MARFVWVPRVLVGLLLTTPVAGVHGQVRNDPPSEGQAAGALSDEQRVLADRLEKAFRGAVRKAGLRASEPGVIVAVVVKGEPVFQSSFGLANVEKKMKIGPKTTFELASDSKMMTAYAILMLVERGEIRLDNDVRTYLPEFPDYGPTYRIHVQHLVHHTSGLPEYLDVVPEHGGRDYVTNADFGRNLPAMKDRFTPQFRPGTKYEYVNTNYMLLGLIIERVTGQSYSEFVRDNIFKPMQMTGAWVHDRPKVTPKDPVWGYVQAVGYERGESGRYEASWGAHPDREEEQLTVGDGAIWCSIEDMIQWERGLRKHAGFSPATWKLAVTPTRLRNGKLNDYGFGLTLEFDAPGVLSGLSHDGSWGGFLTSYSRDVLNDRTVIALSNRGDLDLDEFVSAIDDVISDDLE